jgi:Zn-dependent alcohol dehydrogenases
VQTTAIILEAPKKLGLGTVDLAEPAKDDLVVDVRHSGISTGTEKLFWSGQMPPFPGMGYPLVPGYEAAGEVVEADPATGYAVTIRSSCRVPIATRTSRACSAARRTA